MLQRFEDLQELFEAALVHGLEERTFGDAFLRGNVLAGKVVLFQGLEEMPAGGMLLQVKVDEGMELVFKIHLQRSVASGCELGDGCQCTPQWGAEILVTASGQFSWFERMRCHFHNSLS